MAFFQTEFSKTLLSFEEGVHFRIKNRKRDRLRIFQGKAEQKAQSATKNPVRLYIIFTIHNGPDFCRSVI